MDFLKKHKIVIFIFVLALFIRALLFFINLDAYDGNFEATIHGSDWYFEVSKNLALGNGFSINGVEPSPIHVPLYPLFLATSLYLFGSFWFAVILQIVIGALIPVLGMFVSEKLIPSKKLSLLVGVALALEPNFVLFSFIFFTETLFIFIFLLFILSFISYLESSDLKILSLSSFLLGISVLVKTAPQFLPVLLLPFAWWYLRKHISLKTFIVHGTLFVSIFLIVLSPWLYRNYEVFGVPGMTILPTLNLYATLVPSVLAVENDTSFSVEQASFVDNSELDISTLTFSNASKFNKKAVEVLIQHPKALLEVSTINVLTFFTHDGVLTVLENAGITPETYLSKPAIILLVSSPIEFLKTISKFISSPFVLVLIMRLFWVLVTLSFLVGSIMIVRKKKITPAIALALVVIVYFAVTTASNGLTVNSRFRMPVVPMILTLAAYPFLAYKKDPIEIPNI